MPPSIKDKTKFSRADTKETYDFAVDRNLKFSQTRSSFNVLFYCKLNKYLIVNS